MAQLGSAGALGAYLFTNENDCNNWLSYFYNKLYSDGKWQNFTSADVIKAPALLEIFYKSIFLSFCTTNSILYEPQMPQIKGNQYLLQVWVEIFKQLINNKKKIFLMKFPEISPFSSLVLFFTLPLSANEYKFEEIKFDQVEYRQDIYVPKDKLDKTKWRKRF